MANANWSVQIGQCKMANANWSMQNGQWSVQSGVSALENQQLWHAISYKCAQFDK
ncbi:C-type lectin domain-containing protein [Caenorhabditis elegans]|uniref:C-type lectin domain-containing protein n=1 Tax=Caenorhabditis elegans TaxID=6239 RepID=E9P849_CAEEL|nr:C-type lectin domain-containing protein [Caenorhabditis elegans]CCD68282.1 C-type lectin domain-containing protein [Caenorhabditis elegans]|eukprot:NP_001256986.1 Uncharacterized protein CELE_D1005.10 [Caenorhabditis elegans]